jgi:FAD/FMN-containing dehydrogenase
VTDQVEVLTIEPCDDAATGADDTPRRPPAAGPPRLGRRAGLAAVKSLGWLVYHLRLRALQRAATRSSVGSAYPAVTGRSDRVLAFSDLGSSGRSPTAIQDVEIAVPYDHARAALGALRDHYRSTGRYPLLPVHIRASAASDLWLSPAYGGPVCWIELWQFPHSDRELRRIHALMAPLGYRFHWGKQAPADREYIRRQYPRWDDFARLRAEWDPDGLFLNGYLGSFFSAPR